MDGKDLVILIQAVTLAAIAIAFIVYRLCEIDEKRQKMWWDHFFPPQPVKTLTFKSCDNCACLIDLAKAHICITQLKERKWKF